MQDRFFYAISLYSIVFTLAGHLLIYAAYLLSSV